MIYHIISSNHHKALLWQANIMGPAEQRRKLSEAWPGMQTTWWRVLSPKVTFATLCCKEHQRLYQGGWGEQNPKDVCQNPDISDRKARSLGPSGPMSGTSCLLPTLMAFPWAELPHVATETQFSNPASSASNYIWLHGNQEGVWGQGIFICTKCLLGLVQEMVPREAHVHDITPSARTQHNTRHYLLWALPWTNTTRSNKSDSFSWSSHLDEEMRKRRLLLRVQNINLTSVKNPERFPFLGSSIISSGPSHPPQHLQ